MREGLETRRERLRAKTDAGSLGRVRRAETLRYLRGSQVRLAPS